MKEEQLKEIILETVRKFANCFLEEKRILEKALEMKMNFNSIVHHDKEIGRLKEQQDKYNSLCAGLYDDLREGVITKVEFQRLHEGFKRKAGELEEAQKKQEIMIKELLKKGVVSAGRLKTMQDCSELKEIDRHTLCTMVKEIAVYENRRVELEFYYVDLYGVSRKIKRVEG